MGILVLGGDKGGVGKTTIATNLAQRYEDCVIIDVDPQQSATRWCQTRSMDNTLKHIPCFRKSGLGLGDELKALSSKYGMVIVDAGGHDSVEFRLALAVAHTVVLPICPSQFDVWTLAHMNDVVVLTRLVNPKLDAKVVVNRVSTNLALHEDREVFGMMGDFPNLSVCNTVIHERVSFRRAASEGMAVNEMLKQDSKAVREILGVFNEI